MSPASALTAASAAQPAVLLLMGPTAAGKSALAMAVAEACRARSSTSIRPLCIAAWTLAPPSRPRRSASAWRIICSI